MKLHQLQEARYYKQEEAWFLLAATIAENNMERAKNEDEWDYWRGYQEWLNRYKQQLSRLNDEYKQDRNTFLDHVMDDWEERSVQRHSYAETWASSLEPETFRGYLDLRQTLDGDDVDMNIQDDYLTYATNAMIDQLGAFRGED